MFPKTGNKFRRGHGAGQPTSSYAQLVAAALRSSLDDTHRAIKTVMGWTSAKERTVKNWLSGTHGPHGDYLLVLLGKSDALVDALIGTLPPDRLTELAIRLVRRAGTDRRLSSEAAQQSGESSGRELMPPAARGSMHRSNFDPNDPIHDPKSDPNTLGERTALNHRQRWFLHQLNAGRRIRVGELRREHNVSEKTAKRDIAGLRQLNMITYVGSRRRGEYMSVPMDGPGGKVGH
jgi:hypothetical protein